MREQLFAGAAQVGQRNAVLAGGFGPAAFGECAAGARRGGLAAAAALDVERGRRRPADAVAVWCAMRCDQLRAVARLARGNAGREWRGFLAHVSPAPALAERGGGRALVRRHTCGGC